MALPPGLTAHVARLAEVMVPEHVVRRAARVDLATTDDGRTRADRITGELPRPAWPAFDLTQITPPEGTAFDDLEQYLAALEAGGAAYLTIASPTFTGTLTGPNASLTGTLSVDGDTTLGNSSTDVLIARGHFRHRSSAPSLTPGAALGTGGSMAATIAWATDQAGAILLVSGTTSLGTGTLATITFATARPDTNYAIDIQQRTSTAGVNAVQAYAVADSTTAWTIRNNVAPGSGNTLGYFFKIVEGTN